VSTTPQLSPQQNDRLRMAMIEVWEKRYSRNATHMARDLGLRQPTISEFLRGRGGASYDTAKRFATLIHKSTEAIIGPDEREASEILVERGNERTPSYRDLPGYMEALRFAIQERPDWSPLVWESIGREKAPIGRDVVETPDLITVGDRLQKAERALSKKGLIVPETPRAQRPATPYRRYMSDVRRLAGIGSHAPSSGHMKVK
jgi:hypothetical protein